MRAAQIPGSYEGFSDSCCETSVRKHRCCRRRNSSCISACCGGPGRSDGCPQQQLYPRAAPLRLPAAGRGGLPDVLAARGPEHVPRGGGPGEHHPGEVRVQPQEHPQSLRRGVLPAAHGEHLRGAGQRQRQVRVPLTR